MFRGNAKAAVDIFDYHPLMHYITPDLTVASLHHGYIGLLLLGNKTTISYLLQAKVKSIAPRCYTFILRLAALCHSA